MAVMEIDRSCMQNVRQLVGWYSSSRARSRAQTQRVEKLKMIFFFQAEDGIRDLTVTGVQTCALPIFIGGLRRLLAPHDSNSFVRAQGQDERRTFGSARGVEQLGAWALTHRRGRLGVSAMRVFGSRSARSEERRVGKECGARGGGVEGK